MLRLLKEKQFVFHYVSVDFAMSYFTQNEKKLLQNMSSAKVITSALRVEC